MPPWREPISRLEALVILLLVVEFWGAVRAVLVGRFGWPW
jgi:hypothetical protein